MANYSKNYGEQKNHYMRSGHESVNNPFAHQEKYYQNHQGKKIEEYNEKPQDRAPKFLSYHLKRIKDKCLQRGERGLFSLRRIFKTFDLNGNGVLEYKEFKKAL